MPNKTKTLARVVNVFHTNAQDWSPRGHDTPEGDIYTQMRRLELSEEPVEVLCVACNVDGEFEHDYHDIKLPNGRTVHAVSGYNLERI